MYHFNIRLFCYKLFTLLFFVFCLSYSSDVYAMSIDDYSYNKVYNALPAKYQDNEFVYKSSDNICLIEFADYNGNPYRTSVKKTKDKQDLLYCVDRNNSIEFTDNYRITQDLFNEELATRLAIAFYYGPNAWNQKANSNFTTGNSIVDYYMTQVVVHALIFEYGQNQSNMGIDFDKLSFKDNTGNLKKKTTAFFQYCCDAKIEYEGGYFQGVNFHFNKLKDNNMYLDGKQMISPTITCKDDTISADIVSFNRKLYGEFPFFDELNVVESTSKYDSDIHISCPIETLDILDPGDYHIKIFEDVTYDRKKAALWYCAEIAYMDTTQELGSLTGVEHHASDQVELDLLIGKIYLHKSDSITGEDISDAQFQILQYNSDTNQYEYYCDMTYDADQKRFESKNLYLSLHNQNGKFQVIEKSPGNNYQLDWKGQYFEINSDRYIHEIYVENEPILGKLTLRKTGEKWSYKDQEFVNNSQIPLPKVKFELYAKENIYIKNQVKYHPNQKIVDMVTDQNGIVTIDDLPMGNYYIKESFTLDDYILDNQITEFTITRDSNRQYNHVSLSMSNQLKKSQISIYKYYFDDKDINENNPIPLKNAKFGLYITKDLYDIAGNLILEKDSCVTTGRTDENGLLTFSHLPYVEYYIKELEAPENFILNDGIISLQLEDFQYDELSDCYITKKEIINKIQRFQLTVDKTGEDFTGYSLQHHDYGEYYSYNIGKSQLKDVSFNLYNSNYELVATQTTDDHGKAYFTELIPGRYYLKESNAPAQYKLVDVSRDITLKMDNNNYNEFSPPVHTESIFNELCQCNIRLSKCGERAIAKKNTLEYEQIPLEGVVYGIYQNFDYIFSDKGQSLLKDSCVGYIVTNQEGEGLYNGKLPCGSYYLKELQTIEGYELDTKVYYFDITPNHNKTMEQVLNNGIPFVNQLSKASVQIIKTDANTGKTLKGVEFTLYNANKEPIGVYKTNKKGKIRVDNLPYGKYYFVETKSKDGYYSSNNKYYFELNTEDMVTLNITNSPILKLGIEEGYQNALIITSIILFIFMGIMGLSLYYSKRSEDYE